MPKLPQNPTVLDIVEWFRQLPLPHQKKVIDTMHEIDVQTLDAIARRGDAKYQRPANTPEGDGLDTA